MRRLATIIGFVVALALTVVAQEPQTPASNTSVGKKAALKAKLEVLTDTQGVDFGPYLSDVLQLVRRNWYNLMPEEVRPPELKTGKVSIEFAILKEGKIAGMRIVEPTGDVALDRAAWGGIVASVPFDPLPAQFHGPYLLLRIHFSYNPPKTTPNASGAPPHPNELILRSRPCRDSFRISCPALLAAQPTAELHYNPF
jgi:TonB family protein